MSGFGGFGGFGQNNTQQQNTGFGGFGQAANTNTGFGSTANTGFGSTNTNTGGGLFGSGGSTGFGATGGGFGANNTTSAFGAKPSGFGAPATTTSTGGSLFGGGTSTAGSTGFGGFGATNTAATSSPFGGGNTGGLFGSAAKPAFGSGTTTSSPFGGGATSTGFGSSGGAFGAPATSALGAGAGAGECTGTGSVPFQPHVEKEPNSASNQQNSFQSISFQQPYQKFSPEELRLADYAAGRRYGNASNQAGAFGTSTGFGGFGGGNTTTNAFGANNTTNTGSTMFGGGAASTPFGGAQQSTGFGANTQTTGGLFGQKPATGGLFGSTNTTTPAQTGGGLFGSGGTSAFGGTNNNTGGGLFGNNAAKPATTGFGSAFGSTPASTGTAFGSTAAPTNTFGSTPASGGLFGQPQQQTNSNPFGGNTQTQQQPTTTGFGSAFGQPQQQGQTGGGLFGGAAAKPAGGLFGSTGGTTGGLFGGNNQQPATGTGAFGQTGAQTGGGLFGAPKPATGGLFGGTGNTGTGTTGGLFGGTQTTQPQQQNTGGLFGGLGQSQQQQPKPGGLFGTGQPTGGLFGSSTNQTQQQGGGLFGNSTQQNQQPSGANSLFGGGNSLFGASQQGQQQQQQQQPQGLTASISDDAAFGKSMFSSLASPQIQNPGPLATPLSSSVKQKKSAMLPMYKLNPASSTRFGTPPKRGFGFSYSTYGSPSSASSSINGTPLNASLLGSSLNRGLSRSMSATGMRRSFNGEDSILAPGAFAASPNARQYGSTGSLKKLVINNSLRADLFSPPNKSSTPPHTNNRTGILKRVSFDSNTVGGSNDGTSGLRNVENSHATPSAEEMGYMRSPKTNGTPNGASTPETEQVKGNELAIVPESPTPAEPMSREDQEPGAYWMKPSKQEIMEMNRAQRQKVSGFTVGREGVGQITFDVPVDLTTIDLDNLFDNIIILEVRSATVYPDSSKKPVMGKGLNVPSTISLQNSWPRSKDKRSSLSPAIFEKHVSRLKRVVDTQFKSYDKDTGVWTFTVEHFTTYGLEYDEDEPEGASQFDQSVLSELDQTPTQELQTPTQELETPTGNSGGSNDISPETSEPEDTFEFKKRGVVLPGAFDNQAAFEHDAEMQEDSYNEDSQSFLDEGSVGSQSENDVDQSMGQDDVYEDNESVRSEDQEMAGSFPQTDDTAEHDANSRKEIVPLTPGAVMRARMRGSRSSASPLKRKVPIEDDWLDSLQQTVSPKKQDRMLLRDLRASGMDLPDTAREDTTLARSRMATDNRGFATSIDLMNSLFGDAKSPKKALAHSQGFQWPYNRMSRPGELTGEMDPIEQEFHNSMKPSWGPNGTLVYAAPADVKAIGKASRRAREKDGLIIVQKGAVVSEKRDVRFAHFSNESRPSVLEKQKEHVVMTYPDGIPKAEIERQNFKYAEFADNIDARDPAAVHEKTVWQLASVLFDYIDIPVELRDYPDAVVRLRKDNFSAFWQKLVESASNRHMAMAKSSEEKAIACLAGHKIIEACNNLVIGKDYHLATLVALVGGKESTKNDVREQLDEWQQSRVLSEISQPVRALYEIVAGNVCVCEGSKGAPIEDRIDSFIISKRFGLDWRQAFGLRLWYATRENDSIEVAIQKFAEDLEQDRETARPQAWYVEQGLPVLWDDAELQEREDLLWGLLKLYASDGTADLESILRAENSQLSPIDVRLSWQLSQILTATGECTYGENADVKADAMTLAFASQLTNDGNWLDAIFVLLHLTSSVARAKSIQNHLAHHAGQIGSDDSPEFISLTQQLCIPPAWIWEAKALYMRSVKKDPRQEVECLLHAHAFEEAHRTLQKIVAPRAVIERDYDMLSSLLAGFKGKTLFINDWHLGGEMYADYLEMLEGQKAGKVNEKVVERLLAALPNVMEYQKHATLQETVAVQEISGAVAKVVVGWGKLGSHKDLSKLLRLPLTEDKYLSHTVDLSLGYYRSVMAGGK